MRITAAMFERATGSQPIQDDLERCNCEHAGEVGHWQCGWSEKHNMPRFLVGETTDVRDVKANYRTCHYQLSKAGFMSMARFIGYIWTFNGTISRNPATYIEEDAEWQFTMDAELPSNLRS